MTAPLDRPIWHALTTRQAAFAEGGDRAKRYVLPVSPFAAAADDSSSSLEALRKLIPPAGTSVLLQAVSCPPI